MFIAIPLPLPLKERLAALQDDLPSPSLRRQQPDQMHLTLRFLGDTPAERLERLVPLLRGIRWTPFEITLRGTGVFPDPGHPRMLWTGAEQHPPLMELQEAVESVSRSAGFEPEERRFIPHVTLGRINRNPAGAVRRWLERHREWEAKKIPVPAFVLFESRLTGDRVIHSEHARFKAKAGGK